MITSRDTELAERLREAAAEGRTSDVIKLLEEGAPFIVDNVSIRVLLQCLPSDQVTFEIRATFPTKAVGATPTVLWRQ